MSGANPSVWRYATFGLSVSILVFGVLLYMFSLAGLLLWSHDNPAPRPDAEAVGRACMGGDQAACHEYPVVKDAAAQWRPTVPDHPEWAGFFQISIMVMMVGAIACYLSGSNPPRGH